ncbi:DUF1772 domain-containing protein [Streptomyces sp. RB6PN25]|uniref:DUF1772 domain-containing protein n=1 Tax=Streptomyces humicola TaxID=2953240 RepID=A0ABT1Q1K8_9ACTN|nr:DUF1772 domain-containing protein [Streptomyces humicola]MCQ4083781.1 DUF1772 domain-containing protein [Streptomyces humicola]
MLQFLAPLVVLLNGLAAGVLLGTQLGGFPLLASLPADRYVHAHAFFAGRYDPWMPICLMGTLVGDIALAVAAAQSAAVLFTAGAVLAAAVSVISWTKNVPTNRWVRSLDPDNLPDDFDGLERREVWGMWNRRRAVMTIAALVVNCSALVVLL